MPWCPKCKAEYREDFDFCSDCHCELVEAIEETEENFQFDEAVFLVNVGNQIEAKVLETVLKEQNIPVLRKYPGAGGYLTLYMGYTTSGIDLYVPSKLYDAAKELIEEAGEVVLEATEASDDQEKALLEEGGVEQGPLEQDLLNENETDLCRKRSFRTWLILLFIMPGFIWILLLLLGSWLKNL